MKVRGVGGRWSWVIAACSVSVVSRLWTEVGWEGMLSGIMKDEL